MTDLLQIGEAIKRERKARKLTRDALAKMARVSRARIEAVENQRAPDIGFKKLLRLLNALGLDLRLTAYNRGRPTLDDLRAEQAEEHGDPRLER